MCKIVLFILSLIVLKASLSIVYSADDSSDIIASALVLTIFYFMFYALIYMSRCKSTCWRVFILKIFSNYSILSFSFFIIQIFIFLDSGYSDETNYNSGEYLLLSYFCLLYGFCIGPRDGVSPRNHKY